MAFGRRTDPAEKNLDVVPDASDKLADELYERDTGRSNFVAFLLGGVVVAGGLLAFLYYDSESYLSRGLMISGQAPTIKIIPSNPQQAAPAPMD